MIVSDAFAGDSVEVAHQQHDVYGEALSIIAKGCQRKALIAAAILGVEPPEVARLESGFDHRTLQAAHDIIAAAWRFRANATQTRLPFDEGAALGMPSWLDWLNSEVTAWDNEPSLVHFVLQILGNQNSKPGYLAEGRLTLALLNRYRDVPWNNAHTDLRRRLEKEAF